MLRTMIEQAPIIFAPSLKSVIWGGSRICSYKGIPQPDAKIGESWEVSALPGHESVVESGPYAGSKLSELVAAFGAELLGDAVAERYGGKFPLLVKFLDVCHNISVQVHPRDELAMARHNAPGKNEMWYIVDSDPGAKVCVGFNQKISHDEYELHVAEGSVESILAEHESNPGDVFYLPAGRVHTIGPGNLVAEIQDASDITYRIFDYNRLDSEGKPRELHTDLAREAIDYEHYDNYKLAPVADTVNDVELVHFPHFCVHRLLVDGTMDLHFSTDSFTVLMCVRGEARLRYAGGEMTLRAGRTVLCPAVLTDISLDGKATVLYSRAN